jgi:hypothetical protein
MAKKTIRPIRIEGNIAYVPLTRGYVAVIDAADVHLVEGNAWAAGVSSHTVYAFCTKRFPAGRRTIYLHRVIMGEPGGLEVDHKDCDGLNNRRSNLRTATRAENQRNTRKTDANTSGVKGVSWDKSRAKWETYIKVGGKKRHLGRFDDLASAAAAYSAASARVHGEFGRVA